MASTRHKGFTLIEITLMLVILGLLMAGIVRGNQLIFSARTHSLMSQMENLQAAYIGFHDRYSALPGDYQRASTNITGVAADANGNGDWMITPSGVAGATIDEHIAVWDHLSKSGFIAGSYNYAAGVETEWSAPINAFGWHPRIAFDGDYGTGAMPARHSLKTGNYIPSNVLAEVDVKMDDGTPTGGKFRFSPYTGLGDAPVGVGECYAYKPTGASYWVAATPSSNCGGARLL